jgi:uncharacterized membrane protein
VVTGVLILNFIGERATRPGVETTGLSMGFFEQREAHTRSLIKAVSWRITSSIDTLIISLVLSGRIGLASGIASVEVITKIALYYFHERVWALIPWGR